MLTNKNRIWFEKLINFSILIGISYLVTKPTSIIGLVLSASLFIPLWFLFMSFSSFWERRFSGSLLMTIIYWLLFISIFVGIFEYVLPLLKPYIGQYYE